MRDPKRIDIITNKLNKLWHLVPDMRLVQLISVIYPYDKMGMDPFYIEDDQWEKYIDARFKLLNHSELIDEPVGEEFKEYTEYKGNQHD